MAKRTAPEVNAGSMADIAFLLLIFFLVTTKIETDAGLNAKLPPKMDQVDPPKIKEKNVFEVKVNADGQLLVEEKVMDIADLRKAAEDFLDNNGDGTCDYCKGAKDPSSSDNPDKAVISLQNNRETKYKTYITVQNELIGAYNDLRNNLAQKLYQTDFTKMQDDYNDPKTDQAVKDQLEERIKKIQDMYPQKLSEAEPVKMN
ncbi:ExbD/TolR family protein [Zhouia sp. PK063]|uniref:ExbD/TolR family protein n=1 Tax=Zhouia sp. PK063 TaxID=3373602 RepID=UPI00378EFCF3